MTNGFSQHWTFVLNPIVLPDGVPVELGPQLYLRKANTAEIQVIKHTLNVCVASPFGFPRTTAYERQLHMQTQGDGNAQITVTELPPGEWRYYVITNDGEQNQLFLTHLAANVTNCPLEISAITFSGPRFSGWRPGLLQRYCYKLSPDPELRPTLDNIAELRPTLDNIAELRTTLEAFRPHAFGGKEVPYPEISRAFQMYDSLNFLMENSDFVIIGLFAIVEMLITHNPESKDIGDSITHQMQSKLPLLMRRFEKPVAHGSYFDENLTTKKIWSALYAYRSAVAHGGVADFSGKNLGVLKSAEAAKAYLRAVVRALLRHILTEPQLFRDLKAC